jgi:2-oxoglutarate ferredoxin oxidoreductase subunit alpha
VAERKLFKGNEAVAEAAVRAGCRFFFGYPITPQNEIPEYMSRRLPEVGGVFLQAESEVAAINMVYGAAGAGARVMTSSSSPGISLKQEGLSYIAGAELPCLVVNMVRGGPGLGGIQPAQSDYFQAVKGGGHGDYHLIVFGPASVQEMVDLVMGSFDIAEKYRTPVMILGDGIIGQMMEPVEFPEPLPGPFPKGDWVTDGARGRAPRVINSLSLHADKLFERNLRIAARFEEAKKNEVRVETIACEDADVVLVAYGTTARICKSVVDRARAEGIRAGLVRPISLSPFPEKTIFDLAARKPVFLAVEMSQGQMVEDVRLSVNGRADVRFYGTSGGVIPSASAILDKVRELARSEVRA